MLNPAVSRCDPEHLIAITTLLSRYSLAVTQVTDGASIEGSYWGAPEAGLIPGSLVIRADTPVHSALHEACHYICMDQHRRNELHTDAAGDYDEENAVCYLQILLADELPTYNRERIFADMDAWGYSFRLGSSSLWFAQDAEDAQAWLVQYDLIDLQQQPTWLLRQ